MVVVSRKYLSSVACTVRMAQNPEYIGYNIADMVLFLHYHHQIQHYARCTSLAVLPSSGYLMRQHFVSMKLIVRAACCQSLPWHSTLVA